MYTSNDAKFECYRSHCLCKPQAVGYFIWLQGCDHISVKLRSIMKELPFVETIIAEHNM